MADISFNIACKELKIAQIAQLNQLFQLLHLVHIYGHGFYESSRMLMRKDVNNDVSKDSCGTCLQSGVCFVDPDAKIVKTSFPSYRSIFDQNTLLETSQTNRKCAQESSSGKKWVLKS